MVGGYGEVGVSYKNIAYLTATGRNDWSSTLPVETRSYFYPSVSGSVVFTELIPKTKLFLLARFGQAGRRWGKMQMLMLRILM